MGQELEQVLEHKKVLEQVLGHKKVLGQELKNMMALEEHSLVKQVHNWQVQVHNCKLWWGYREAWLYCWGRLVWLWYWGMLA